MSERLGGSAADKIAALAFEVESLKRELKHVKEEFAEQVRDVKQDFAEHRTECSVFKKEARDAIVEFKVTFAKWSGLAVFVMGAVGFLSQVFTSQILPPKHEQQQEQRHQQNE